MCNKNVCIQMNKISGGAAVSQNEILPKWWSIAEYNDI